MTEIETMTAKVWGVQPEMLYSSTKKREVTMPRQVCMLVHHKFYKMRLKDVAAMFGLRNHATILYGCRTVTGLYPVNVELRNRIDELIYLLNLPEDQAHKEMQLERRRK